MTEEQLLDGDNIRLGHPKKLRHVIVNDLQTPGKFGVRRCGDGTAFEQLRISPISRCVKSLSSRKSRILR